LAANEEVGQRTLALGPTAFFPATDESLVPSLQIVGHQLVSREIVPDVDQSLKQALRISVGQLWGGLKTSDQPKEAGSCVFRLLGNALSDELKVISWRCYTETS
jgi:hypothetical protein